MRIQYNLLPSEKGYVPWDVDKLIEKSRSFPVFALPLSELKELDQPFWYQDATTVRTVRSIANHFKLVQNTRLEYPIILAQENRIMDGMHRVVKALLEGRETINTVKFEQTPEPDFKDVMPEELSYDKD